MKIFLILFFFLFSLFTSLNFTEFKKDDILNRRVYAFNRGLDKSFLNPSIIVYINLVPNFLDRSLNNFYKNISEIQNGLFSFILKDFAFFDRSLYSFFLNSFFGLYGFFDISMVDKSLYIYCDFQTFLFKRGYRKITYMMLPIIGPSTLFFNIGLFISHLSNPFFYFYDYVFFYYFFELLNKKSLVFFDSAFFHYNMIDGYTFLKDVYIQNSQRFLNNDFDFFLSEPPD